MRNLIVVRTHPQPASPQNHLVQRSPSAPEPGIYAAADFSGQFESDPIYCGYIAWHRDADGSYRIVREEENFIDKDSVAAMKPEEVKALAAKFGCSMPQ